MSSSIPISLDGTDALGVAIRLRAAKDGVSPEEVVQSILRKALAPELEEASGTLPLTAVIQKVMQSNGKTP
jgi:plasmid stability protein